ncbi:hypothetical protein [Agromyces soli]|nr:hypothetical protein [Agromyces soli]
MRVGEGERLPVRVELRGLHAVRFQQGTLGGIQCGLEFGEHRP